MSLRNIFLSSLILLTLLFTSCEGLFQNSDLKKIIEEQIEYISANSFSVVISASDPQAGNFVTGGGEKSVKVTDFINIEYAVNDSYVFIKWLVKDSAGEDASDHVKIDVSSTKQKVELLKEGDLKITALCYKRPAVNEVNVCPKNLPDGVSKNSAIVIPYNIPLSEKNDLSKISILIDGEDAKNSFISPLIVSNVIEINPDNASFASFSEGRKTVTVTIPEDFYYISDTGEKIFTGSEFTYSYIINSSMLTDTIKPEVNEFQVYSGINSSKIPMNENFPDALYKEDAEKQKYVHDTFVTNQNIYLDFAVLDADTGIKSLNVTETLICATQDGSSGSSRTVKIYATEFSSLPSKQYNIEKYRYKILSPDQGKYKLDFAFEDWTGNISDSVTCYIITDIAINKENILLDVHNIELNPYYAIFNPSKDYGASREHTYYLSRFNIMNFLPHLENDCLIKDPDDEDNTGITLAELKANANKLNVNELSALRTGYLYQNYYTFDQWYYCCYDYPANLHQNIRYGTSRDADNNLPNSLEPIASEDNDFSLMTICSSGNDEREGKIYTNQYDISSLDSQNDTLIDVIILDNNGNLTKETHFIPSAPTVLNYKYTKTENKDEESGEILSTDTKLEITSTITCPEELAGKYKLYQVLYYSDSKESGLKRAHGYITDGNGVFENIPFTGNTGYFYLQTFAFYEIKKEINNYFSIYEKNFIPGRVSEVYTINVADSSGKGSGTPSLTKDDFNISVSPLAENYHNICVSLKDGVTLSENETLYIKALNSNVELTNSNKSYTFKVKTSELYNQETTIIAGDVIGDSTKEIEFTVSSELIKDNVKPELTNGFTVNEASSDFGLSLICTAPKDSEGGFADTYDVTVYAIPLTVQYDNGHSNDMTSAKTLIEDGFMTEADICEKNASYTQKITLTKDDTNFIYSTIPLAGKKYIICMEVSDKAGNTTKKPCLYYDGTSHITSSQFVYPILLDDWEIEEIAKDYRISMEKAEYVYLIRIPDSCCTGSGQYLNNSDEWVSVDKNTFNITVDDDSNEDQTDNIYVKYSNTEIFSWLSDTFVRFSLNDKTVINGDPSSSNASFSGPFWYYFNGNQIYSEGKVMNYIMGATGPIIFTDNPVYVETVSSSVNYGESIELWNKWVPAENRTNPKLRKDFTETSFSYCIDKSQIPAGHYYTVLMHFADGTTLMTPVYINGCS